MRRRAGWATLAVAVALSTGCGGPAQEGEGPVGGSPGADEAPAASGVAAVAADSGAPGLPADPEGGGVVTVSSGDVPASGDPAPGAGSVPRAPAGEKPRLVPLEEILAGGAQPGERVRVEGLCIGYARVVAAGPQPRTRSDWQLVQGDAAVWVAGPYPAGCSGTEPAQVPATYTVVVAVDTLPALGAAPPRPRPYLIHAPPE